jgi:hypothetical protein
MSERPVHPSAGEVAEDGVKVERDAATDVRGVVVHVASREPIGTGEKKGEGNGKKNEEKAA